MVFNNRKTRYVFYMFKKYAKDFFEENFTHNINLCYINLKKKKDHKHNHA